MKSSNIRVHALALAFGLAGCATYHATPIEIEAVLAELEAVRWSEDSVPKAKSAGDAVPGPRELAAFAVVHNPALAAQRAEWDVHQALLVEAGLLPNLELGWDGMGVLASQIKDGTSSSTDALGGLEVMLPLMRPGELDARKGVARERMHEVRAGISKSEWQLTRDVFVACEQLNAAQSLAKLTGELSALLESTSDYFQRARSAGAVTAIESNLALGELQAMQLRVLQAQAELVQKRQLLNGLLGLPPDTRIEFERRDVPSEREELDAGVDLLTQHAIQSLPSLKERMAGYEASEQELRLAISKQYPMLSLGTGIRLVMPIFTDHGAAAIETAKRRRAQLARELKAGVHEVRQEIAAHHALWQIALREVELVETQLLPNAEQTLELSQASLRAGEITLLETLALQRALVEARTRRIEARAQRAVHAWNLLAASGWLLDRPDERGHTANRDDEARE